MEVLITGASGFIGTALVNALKHQVNFTKLPSKTLFESELNREPNNELNSELKGELNSELKNKLNNESASDLVKSKLSIAPTLIHLAGISAVGDCEKNLAETYKVNVALPCALAEAFFKQNKGGNFIFTSTGQVYDEAQSIPHNEETKLAPTNIYARSKLCAELALKEIAQELHGRLTILRLYNHTHRSQNVKFVLPSVLKQIQMADTDLVRLKVGNIDVERDFSAIQDLVAAFEKLLIFEKNRGTTELVDGRVDRKSDQSDRGHKSHRSGINGISEAKAKDSINSSSAMIETFNLCSGVGKNLRQLIFGMADRMGKKVEFEVDPLRLRAGEPIRLVGDSTKFSKKFNWTSGSTSIPGFLDQFLGGCKAP